MTELINQLQAIREILQRRNSVLADQVMQADFALGILIEKIKTESIIKQNRAVYARQKNEFVRTLKKVL